MNELNLLKEKIKETNRIEDVISELIPSAPPIQGNKNINCSFHDDKTPSLSVNINEQYFYCFGCGLGGDVFKFVEKYKNITFTESMKYLADRAGISFKLNEHDLKKS